MSAHADSKSQLGLADIAAHRHPLHVGDANMAAKLDYCMSVIRKSLSDGAACAA